MAYIDNEINKKARENFYHFFYSSDYSPTPLGTNYVSVGTEIPDISQFGVTDFIVKKETDTEITIEICVQRPGILIGYHGNLITSLSKFMWEQMGKKVIFNIFESTMWNTFKSSRNSKILDTELKY